jgi:glutaconyl-CoA decarboxylase
MEQSRNYRADEQQTLTITETIMKLFRVVVNDVEYRVGIEELQEETAPAANPVPPSPAAASPAPQQPQKPVAASSPQPTAAEGSPGGAIAAPMPGTVIAISVTPGSSVIKGQTLLVLEAMKMENDIKAPTSGTIQEIKITEGASVNAGDILIVLTP